LNLLILLLY